MVVTEVSDTVGDEGEESFLEVQAHFAELNRVPAACSVGYKSDIPSSYDLAATPEGCAVVYGSPIIEQREEDPFDN